MCIEDTSPVISVHGNEIPVCSKEELENIHHCLSEYLRTGELTTDHIRDTTDAMNIVTQYWLRTVFSGPKQVLNSMYGKFCGN